MERILSCGYMSIDPALATCRHTVVGFCWSEIPERIALTAQQKRIFQESRIAGLGEGDRENQSRGTAAILFPAIRPVHLHVSAAK